MIEEVKVKIRKKKGFARISAFLFGGFAVLLGLILVIGALSIKNSFNYSSDYNRLYRENVLSALYLSKAQNSLWELRNGLLHFMVADTATKEQIIEKETNWFQVIEQNLAEYEKLIVNTQEKESLAALQESYFKYAKSRPQWFKLYNLGQIEMARDWMANNTEPFGATVVTAFEQQIALQIKQGETSVQRMLVQSNSIKIITSVLLGFALIVGSLVGLLVTRRTVTPFFKATEFAGAVSQGDLTQRLALKRKDEVGLLSTALDGMAEKLSGMVVTIKQSAEQVATSSREISAFAVGLSEEAQNQASTIEQTSASMEELNASVEQVSEHAKGQLSAVEGSRQAMHQVRQSLDELSRSLENVAAISTDSITRSREGAAVVGRVLESISALSTGTEKISSITGMISEIADRTNLLALNASIEAARAGEQGQGFAVVAVEIGKLAIRSADSAKEITALIKRSVGQVTAGVKQAEGARATMDQITMEAQKAIDMLDALNKALTRQTQSIDHLNDALEHISQMSKTIDTTTAEQTTNARQVAMAIENLNELTQKAAGAAEDMSAFTGELVSLAQSLQKLVGQFKLNNSIEGD